MTARRDDEARREAEQAAAEALYTRALALPYGLNMTEVEAFAAAAVAAVWPVAERAVRERVAAAIRSQCCDFDGCNATACMAFDHAARIAAAIRAAGHPDGYHRVDTTREWAGIYCADCAVTERSARIAETAPEPCLCAGHYMACDEPCPDFWLPDVPMSPDKGHGETAPEPEEGP